MTVAYPSILRRYLSTLIDLWTILGSFFITSMAFPGKDPVSNYLRVGIPLVLFLFYEPLCTSRFCTLGQFVTGIRVRRVGDYGMISLPAAYLRYAVKILLGFISFFSIIFSERNRAIHDFSTGSVVIEKERA